MKLKHQTRKIRGEFNKNYGVALKKALQNKKGVERDYERESEK